ncbi:MAG: hypothetical protein RR420_03005 [Anaerovoracaceae bacterium]
MKARKKVAFLLTLTMLLSVFTSGIAYASTDVTVQSEKQPIKTTQSMSLNSSLQKNIMIPISSGQEIVSKTFYSVSPANGSRTNDYFKYVATVDGTVTITGPSGYITLCDKNKDPISAKNGDYINYTSTVDKAFKVLFYGVKKGETYWFRVEDSNHSKYDETTSSYKHIYYLAIDEKSFKERSGSKRSNSTTIKKNSSIFGSITAGQRDYDYYKFNTTKTSNTIYLSAVTNKALKMEVYHKYRGGTYKRVITSYRLSDSLKLSLYGSGGKGTYYIKVYGGDSTSSGAYQIKWK